MVAPENMESIQKHLFTSSARFTLVRPLGRGGMGAVFEARDEERNRNVALKVLANFGPKQLYLFKQEFRSLSNILHANLVPLHELLCEQGLWFFTMEVVNGDTFLDHVRGGTTEESADHTDFEPTVVDNTVNPDSQTDPATGAIIAPRVGPALGELDSSAETRLRESLVGLTEGVMALHAAGKLHRDLKPSNVKVEPDGKVVILDFGLVTDLDVQRDGGQINIISGTVPYMSPEQGAGESLTPASDWYALGVMLYEALAGRLPYSGTISEVLRVKQDRDAIPVEELTTDLPTDLAALCNALLSRDPEARPDGEEILRRLGHSPAAAVESSFSFAYRRVENLVGRERLLDELHDAFMSARSGSPTLLHVQGRSGMGKSALLQTFLAELAEQQSAIVLSGRCYERESVPYKALDPLIDSLTRVLLTFPSARVANVLPRHVRALTRVFPVLAQVKTLANAVRTSEPARDLREIRRRAFVALRELLGRLAQQLPVILHIDDMQWGDMDSAMMLAELLRPPDAPPVLLILSYRSENMDNSRVLAALGTIRSGVERLELEVGALSENDACRLALQHLTEDPERAELASHIARESGGIPFFIEELSRHASLVQFGSQALPSMDGFTRHRVGRLSSPARTLLEAVAVAGQPVPQNIVFQAAGLSEAPFEAVQALRVARLVRTHGSGAEDLVECYHDRIREAVGEGLKPDQRAGYHLRLAVAIEPQGDAEAEALSRHYREAGELRLAARYARSAAEQATRALAFDRAAALYRSCLEMGDWERSDATAIQLELADVLASAGRGSEAAEAFLKASELTATQDGWRFQLRAAEQLLQSGHIDRGRIHFGKALEQHGLAMPTGQAAILAQYLRLRARVRLRGTKFTPTPESEIPRKVLERIDACWSVALGLALVEPVRAGIFQFRALLLALKCGEPRRVALCLAFEAGYAAAFGGAGYRRSNELMEQAEAVARTVDDPSAIAFVRVCSAISSFQQGDWKRTLERAEEAERICLRELKGASWSLHTARVYQLAAQGWRGRFGQARLLIRELVSDAYTRNDLHTANHTRAGSMLHIELMNDDPVAARRDIAECTSDLSQEGFTTLHMYAQRSRICIELYLGNGKAALELAIDLQARFQKAMIKRIALIGIYNLEMQTNPRLCAAGQEISEAEAAKAALANAASVRKVGLAWTRALARLWESAAAVLQGNLDEAMTQYGQAADMFHDVDMLLYENAARFRQGELMGGAEGQELMKNAIAALKAEEVANPEGVMAMVAPPVSPPSS
jgi:eukaryotic-like serine/threonine-protein kinase